MDNYTLGLGLLVISAGICFIALRTILNRNKNYKINNLTKINNTSQNIPSPPPQTTSQTTNEMLQQTDNKVNNQLISQNPLKAKQLSQKKTKNCQYQGSFDLMQKSPDYVTALTFKQSKILLATSKNQLILYSLQNCQKTDSSFHPQQYSLSLNNNTASALYMSQNYYITALTSDKTIAYYILINNTNLQLVHKFNKNILKSNANTIYISKQEKYILTTGSKYDTIIDIWTMNGNKLTSLNSFQIQHYSTSCGTNNFIIRGWEDQIKIFHLVQQQNGEFKQLNRLSKSLYYDNKAFASAIDNKDMYVVTISKFRNVKIWNIANSTNFQLVSQSTQSNTDIYQLKPNKCAIHTFETSQNQLKTLVVLSNYQGFIVTDIHLRTLQLTKSTKIKHLYISSTQDSLYICIQNTKNQIRLLNLLTLLDKITLTNQ